MQDIAELILASAKDYAIFTTDLDRHVTHWNAGAEALMGYSEADISGRSADILFVPEDRAQKAPQHEMDLALTEGRATNERWHCRKDGSRFYGSGVVTPLRDEDERIVGLVKVMRDLTQQKQIEAVLQQNKERQAFLLELSDALRPLSDPVAVQAVVTQLAMAHFKADRCYYCEIVGETAIIRQDAARPELPSTVGVYDLDAIPVYQAVLKAGRTFVVNDVRSTDVVDEPLRQLCIQLQIISFVNTPVIRNGHLIGMFCLVKSTPCEWTGIDVELTQEVSERTWTAVERARAEIALSRSEEKFRTLFNSMDEGFYLADIIWNEAGQAVDISYVDENPAAVRMVGQSAKGRLLSDLDPNYEQYWRDTFGHTARTGEAQRLEQYAAPNDIWFNFYVFKPEGLTDDHRFAVVFHDVTERHHAEERLHESQRFVQGIITSLPLVIYIFDVQNHRNLYLSPQVSEVFGYTPEEMQASGTNLLPTFFHPDDLPQISAYFDQIIRSADDQVFHLECRIKHKQRGWLWVVCRDIIYARDADGRPTQLLGTAEDINERKEAEQALRDSEKRLRLVIEATNMGTWEWNLTNDEVYWNEQHFRLFGMQPKPQPIRPNDFFSHVHPDDRDRVKALLQKAIDERGVYDAEFNAVLEDGTRRWLSGYGRVVEEIDGKPVCISGVMFDIDERKRAEYALREANQRKDEFLAMLAHELRNPLAPIHNGLQILSLTEQTTRETSPLVAMMNRQVDHLVRLVDDLLDVSRISRGKIELRRERVEFGGVVSGAVEAARPLNEARRQTLLLQLPTTPLYVDGDATRLAQVVTNLLTNATRYTGEAGTVRVSLEAVEGEALLRVTDNGIGIAPEQLESIFDLFMQVDTSLARPQGGLGLGLTLTRRIVEMHSGRVEARSAGLGEGSEFSVYLPLLNAAQS